MDFFYFLLLLLESNLKIKPRESFQYYMVREEGERESIFTPHFFSGEK